MLVVRYFALLKLGDTTAIPWVERHPAGVVAGGLGLQFAGALTHGMF
jgi:hypothetical protein